jgi:hypothetical protein
VLTCISFERKKLKKKHTHFEEKKKKENKIPKTLFVDKTHSCLSKTKFK